MVIETPSRGSLEAYVVYKAYRVKVSGRELVVDFIVLDFSSLM